MAFGLRRWLIAALACCGLVAVAFLPPEREEPWRWVVTYRSHEARLESVLRMLQSRLDRLELRDSLLASASEDLIATESGPLLLVEAGLPQMVQDTARASAEEPFSAVRNRVSEYRAVVAVTERDLLGQWTGPGVFSGLKFYLPAATDGETCLVAVARGREVSETSWLRGISFALREHALLGPCAYYAAFGRPGTHIEEWLESTDYIPAMLPAWTVDAGPRVRIPPIGGHAWIAGWDGTELFACAAGNRYTCRSVLLAGSRPRRYTVFPSSQRERGMVGAESYRFYTWPLGPNGGRFLSDLMAEMGEQRFVRFWSSEAALETAFAAAFGVGLEEWVMVWARGEVGRVPRLVPDLVSAVLGLLLASVLVGGTTFLASRRQVA